MRSLLIILLTLISSTAKSASFSCSLDGLSEVETTICSSPSLSKDDEVLSSVYSFLKYPDNALLIRVINSEQLISDQKAWLKERNACNSEKCISTKYNDRIVELMHLFSQQKLQMGSALKTLILNKLISGSSYELATKSAGIHFFRYSESLGGYVILFESSAAGFFNYFDRSGLGYCGGDNDSASGVMVVTEDLKIKSNYSYIGNGCQSMKPVVIIEKKGELTDYRIEVKGMAVADKYKNTPLISFSAYSSGDIESFRSNFETDKTGLTKLAW